MDTIGEVFEWIFSLGFYAWSAGFILEIFVTGLFTIGIAGILLWGIGSMIAATIRPMSRKARKRSVPWKGCVRYKTGYGPKGKLPVK